MDSKCGKFQADLLATGKAFHNAECVFRHCMRIYSRSASHRNRILHCNDVW